MFKDFAHFTKTETYFVDKIYYDVWCFDYLMDFKFSK